MTEPRPSFFSRILKSGYSLNSPDFFMEQTVTTIARKLNFSGFGRNFSSFSQTSVLQMVINERRTCFSLVQVSRRRMKRHRCDMQNDGAVDSPTLTLRWGEFESQVQLLYGQTDPNARGLSLLLSNMTANSRIDREVTHSSLQIF